VREEYPHIAINQKLSKTLTETLTNNDEDANTNQIIIIKKSNL
jgi:hypothetical protein